MTTSSSSGDVGPLPGPTVEPSGTRQTQETFDGQQTILEELRSQEQAAMAALLKIGSTDLPAMERARNIFLTHMTAVEKQKEQVALAEKIYRSAAEAGLRYAAGQKHPAIVNPPSAPTAIRQLQPMLASTLAARLLLSGSKPGALHVRKNWQQWLVHCMPLLLLVLLNHKHLSVPHQAPLSTSTGLSILAIGDTLLISTATAGLSTWK
jgi:hypothetical protein